MVTFAILGLGEAGSLYARDLAAAGRPVTGFDPAGVPTPPGILRCATIKETVAGADVVISLTGPDGAAQAAADAADALRPGAVYADLNTAAPQAKRAIEASLAPAGALVADVAVLAPVPRAGLRTPVLASGPGAGAFAAAVGQLAVPVEVLDEETGAAAGRKLLRSVFMKGLAAVALEAMTAGEAARCGDWIRKQMADELSAAGPILLDRLVTGSRLHASRRAHEMAAARGYLSELGVPTAVTDASLWWLHELAGPDR